MAFSAGALGKQAERSVRRISDPVWAEAEGAVLTLARRFQQARDSQKSYLQMALTLYHMVVDNLRSLPPRRAEAATLVNRREMV